MPLMNELTADDTTNTTDPAFAAGVRTVLDHAPEGAFQAGPTGLCEYVNPQWCHLTGLTEQDALGDGWTQTVHPEDRDRVVKNWAHAVTHELPFAMEFRIQGPLGAPCWLATRGSPVRDRSGTLTGYLGWVSDVTKKVALEQYLEAALMDQVKLTEVARGQGEWLRLFHTVFERAPMGITITDISGTIIDVNEAMLRMAQYGRDELLGMPTETLLAPQDRQRTTEVVVQALVEEGREHVSVEHRLVRKDGTERWVRSDTSLVADDVGELQYSVTLATDITEKRLFEEHLAHEASHDSLTGLPNRSLMRELLAQAAARTHRHHRSLAVMFVDLDHFKDVNDLLGHAAGDAVLRGAAQRISSSLRLGDVVARVGGDEFVVVCEDAGEHPGAVVVADRILQAMAVPFAVDGQEVTIGASVGITLSDGGDDIDTILEHADQALYQAKRAGRNQAALHDRRAPVAVVVS